MPPNRLIDFKPQMPGGCLDTRTSSSAIAPFAYILVSHAAKTFHHWRTARTLLRDRSNDFGSSRSSGRSPWVTCSPGPNLGWGDPSKKAGFTLVRQGEKLNVSFFPVRRAPVIHI